MATEFNDLFASHRFSCGGHRIITDLVMPEKEGLELLLDLRRIVQNAKCIAMSESGPVGEAYLEVALKFGAKLTLSKPFTDEEFSEAVNSTLEP